MRIGIATGYALLFEGDDYIGSAVNLASRLCDAAGPCEVLMPALAARHAARRASTPTRTRRSNLRGFPGPVDVVQLSGHMSSTDGRNDTGELWTRSPFVA